MISPDLKKKCISQTFADLFKTCKNGCNTINKEKYVFLRLIHNV